MQKYLELLLIFGLSLLLLACQTEAISTSTATLAWTVTAPQPVSTLTHTSTVSASPSPSPTKSATPIPTTAIVPTATSTLIPTMTPTPIPVLRIDGIPIEDTCVEPKDTLAFSPEIFQRPNFEIAMRDYLNAGGTINALSDALTVSDPERAIRMQIVVQDITQNGIPEMFMGITIPYQFGDGETHLLFFTCENQQYQEMILFRRAGAGSRAEGLYAGGGVDIVSVGDLNADGLADLFFSARWPGFGEHYLLQWGGEQFSSLIEYQGVLGETRYWIETYGGDVEVRDLEGDGIFEILVLPEAGTDGDPLIWRWDGQRYILQ